MTHIISRDKGFNFIHIPKNGGSTIRHSYLPFDDCGQKFAFSVTEHEDLGTIAQGHLPLWVIRKYYPDEFAQIETGWSCAITRDPMERFRSAMAQRLREFRGLRLEDLGKAELDDELGKIMDHITKNPYLPQAEFCHFTRQRDFIYLDGKKVVGNVYPLERINDLLAELARRTGVQATEERVNTTEVATRRGFSRIAKTGWKAVKPLLPKGVQNRLRRRLQPFISTQPKVEDAAIWAFVHEFYAEDIVLHAEVTARAAG